MRPVLLSLAFLNLIVLGTFAYRLIVPADGPAAAGSIHAGEYLSGDDSRLAPASVIAVKPGVAGAQLPEPVSSGMISRPSLGPDSNPVARSARPSYSSANSAPGASHGSLLDFSITDPDDQAPNSSSQSAVQQPSFAQAVAQPAAGSASFVSVNTASTTHPAATAPDVSIPLAFSTSADGATPAQAATLHQLQSDFTNTVSAQGQNPNDPAYARAWRTAQAVSDSNFEQQFGAEAFIEAQLAQVHGGTN